MCANQSMFIISIIHDGINKVAKIFFSNNPHPTRFYMLKLCVISVKHSQVFKIFMAKIDLLPTKYVLELEMTVDVRSLD